MSHDFKDFVSDYRKVSTNIDASKNEKAQTKANKALKTKLDFKF